MYQEPFDAQILDSGRAGPSLCIVGGVHGNEPAGVDAIEHFRSELASSGRLKRGRLTILIANTRALREGKRVVDYDLNRCFGVPSAKGHEATLARNLDQVLTGADYVLDLHSTSAEGPVFGAGARSRKHAQFCSAVGVGIYTYGWSEPRAFSMLVDAADRAGAVGLLVECGQHTATSTRERAVDCVSRALAWLGMTSEPIGSSTPSRLLALTDIVKTRTLFRFHRKYRNFDRVATGETVGIDGDRPWTARREFIILIPSWPHAKSGEDAFAIGDWATEMP